MTPRAKTTALPDSSDQVGTDSKEGNPRGSTSLLDPIPSRCQAGLRTHEFGFGLGSRLCPWEPPNSRGSKTTCFLIPEEGLEPTRPCGQRILSAPKDCSRVTVGRQLAVFLGNDMCRSSLDSLLGAHAPNSLPNTFPTLPCAHRDFPRFAATTGRSGSEMPA